MCGGNTWRVYNGFRGFVDCGDGDDVDIDVVKLASVLKGYSERCMEGCEIWNAEYAAKWKEWKKEYESDVAFYKDVMKSRHGRQAMRIINYWNQWKDVYCGVRWKLEKEITHLSVYAEGDKHAQYGEVMEVVRLMLEFYDNVNVDICVKCECGRYIRKMWCYWRCGKIKAQELLEMMLNWWGKEEKYVGYVNDMLAGGFWSMVQQRVGIGKKHWCEVKEWRMARFLIGMWRKINRCMGVEMMGWDVGYPGMIEKRKEMREKLLERLGVDDMFLQRCGVSLMCCYDGRIIRESILGCALGIANELNVESYLEREMIDEFNGRVGENKTAEVVIKKKMKMVKKIFGLL